MCARNQEGQLYPGLYPQQCGHRAREGILPLCSGETPLGVLCPALALLQQVHVCPVLRAPEEATAMIQGLKPLCSEERLRELGLFSLEKRRPWRDLSMSFQYLKAPARKLERDFYKGMW